MDNDVSARPAPGPALLSPPLRPMLREEAHRVPVEQVYCDDTPPAPSAGPLQVTDFLLGSWGLGAPQAVATLVEPLPCDLAVLSFVVVFPSKWCPGFRGAETRPWRTGESLY